MARNRVGVEAAGSGNELDIMSRVDVNPRISIYIAEEEEEKNKNKKTNYPGLSTSII